MKIRILLPCFLLLASVIGSANEKGNGGDPLALQFKAAGAAAIHNMETLNAVPFAQLNFGLIQDELKNVEVLITDGPLDVFKNGIDQSSTAINIRPQNLIIINREKYSAITNTFVQQALALHELLSLQGLESTGNYPICSQYLITEFDASAATARQVLASGSQSMLTDTPCRVPSADVARLFSMIDNAGVSAQDILSYMQSDAISPTVESSQCRTPFTAAIEQGRIDVYQVLYDAYLPDLNLSQLQDKESIYSSVLEHGSLQFLQLLQNEATATGRPLQLWPGAESFGFVNPLFLAAAQNSSVEMIQYLLQTGNDIDALNDQGRSALTLAAEINVSVDVINTLIRAGANVNLADVANMTPLMRASSNNPNPGVTDALIAAGAAVNCRDKQDMSPLMWAASNNSVDVVNSLIRAGADVNAKGGRSKWSSVNFAAADNSSEVVLALLGSGAQIDGVDDNGDSALINLGLYLSSRIARGDTGAADVADALILKGANVNIADNSGETALIAASFPAGCFANESGPTCYDIVQQTELIRVLVENGADLDAKTKDGLTALDIARQNDAPASIIQLLGG